jgi:hypothetical protein
MPVNRYQASVAGFDVPKQLTRARHVGAAG